ncbi:hypothetical protein [Rhodopirellula bahusiensis]|uniref:Uncharacterized protein n=1 Tax=Rhodopirellula bahusiensis TaxID=2014065 RepID=A0A2G1W726_9BACT|nr:hypothetical protein [Rhodopirellula bahusiensis]PHQ34817.1 hypothetical protein CEE69_13165 [Rhodopirellula bahusiensis]
MNELNRLLTDIEAFDIDEINKLISDLGETFADCENKRFTSDSIRIAGRTVVLSRDELMILQEKLKNAKFDLQDTEKTIAHMYDGVPPSN